MITAPTCKPARFHYAATLLGALAVVVLAPATAHADNEPNGPSGGCTYTDADGYDVPVDDGQDVLVDRKIVSCRGGSIVVTTAPRRGVGNVRAPMVTGNLPVISDVPEQSPVADRNVPVFIAKP
jgi:hypothetical protein